jgi:hypothetical protein
VNPVADSKQILETVDRSVEREERAIFLRLLHENSGSKPAEWRLRVKRQQNIVSELTKLGPLAVLSAGSMLITWSGQINMLERKTHWRETLEESPMMKHMSLIQRAQLIGAKSQNWDRFEKAFQNLGRCLCLAVKDLSEYDILVGMNQLKIDLVQVAFSSDRATDNVIEYIKWLGKSCQHVFLRSTCPLSSRPTIKNEEGDILPFTGTLKYISDEIQSGKRRTTNLSYERARQLSQLGNVPRGLPYPSPPMVKKSVAQTVNVITSTFTPTKVSLEKFKTGLDTIVEDNGTELLPKSHVSLAASGKYDNPRSQNGGSALLVVMTRKYTDSVLTLDIIESLAGKFDQFGEEMLSHSTAAMAKIFLGLEKPSEPKAFTVTATIGDILYVPVEELLDLWEITLRPGKKSVPVHLAKLLNLTASMMLLEAGYYNQPMKILHGVMTFESRNNEFYLHEKYTFPVKADVSIEAGLKTRLTTGGLTAFAHLSQLPANYMREYLSKDPFHRTGFQEPDKLWTVLKAYKTRFYRDA